MMSFFHNSRGKCSFEIFFIPRKNWCESFSESKNNIWKEKSVSFSEPKKALLSENVIRLQNQIERCLNTFEH